MPLTDIWFSPQSPQIQADNKRKERKKIPVRVVPQLKDTIDLDSGTSNLNTRLGTLGTELGTLDTKLESLGTGNGLLIGSLALDGSWQATG